MFCDYGNAQEDQFDNGATSAAQSNLPTLDTRLTMCKEMFWYWMWWTPIVNSNTVNRIEHRQHTQDGIDEAYWWILNIVKHLTMRRKMYLSYTPATDLS